MVKRIKFIFTRIIIGVGICLILQYLQGSLIGDVNAQVLSYYTSNGNNFGSCSNCNDYTYDYVMFSNSSGKTGYLSLNALLYSTIDNSNYIPIMSRVRVVSNSIHYNCEVTSTGFSHELYNTGGQVMNASSYSITCPMAIGPGGISSIYFQFSGTANFSFYSPATFIVSDNNQEVINAIEQGTQQTIDSQKTCKKYDKNNIKIDGKYLINNGTYVDDNNYGITNYIKINDSTTITPLTSFNSVNANYCFYDINKDLISCSYISSFSANVDLTIPTNASYFRSSIAKPYNKPTYKVCNNGNQGVVDSTDALNDTLNDDNVSSGTNDSIGGLLTPGTQSETFGPVADLLLLPLTLFGAFYSGFDNTCTPFNLGSLFNTNITLPCINLRNILGASLYNTIDIAISLFMILNIVLMCIDIFDRITSLEDPFNELYSPKHVYQPRHGGGR